MSRAWWVVLAAVMSCQSAKSSSLSVVMAARSTIGPVDEADLATDPTHVRRPTEAELATLLEMFGDPTSQPPYTGEHPEKKCGGFHADLTFTWRRGDQTRWRTFCFGCCDIKGDAVGSKQYDCAATRELARKLFPAVTFRDRPVFIQNTEY